MEKLREELHTLTMEKEVLSYKTFWDGKDYRRNREITDRIYEINRILRNGK